MEGIQKQPVPALAGRDYPANIIKEMTKNSTRIVNGPTKMETGVFLL